MKLELKPRFSEDIRQFGFEATHTGVSKDGHISWTFNNSFLQVNQTQTNEVLSSWRCGKACDDDQCSIVSVTDLSFKGTHLLLIATETLAEEGTLCIFNVKLKKIVRAIEIPQKITAVEVVFADPDDNPPKWVISQHLLFFSGLVAVGTQGCYTYLVDLCLDELSFRHSNEAHPRKLSVVSPNMVNPDDKKNQARHSRTHLALLLDDQCHRQGQFYYRRQDDTIQKVMDEDSAFISCLKYVDQAGELVIGFSFGSFQLWRIYNPVLDYSSHYKAGQAVTHVINQEPENDPRSLLYLWIGHGDYSGERIDSVAMISLYQMSFRKKETHAGFGVFYDEIESVCARLDHHLTMDPYFNDTKSTLNSHLLSCFTISHPFFKPAETLTESYDEGHPHSDLSLSVFLWRSENKQQTQTRHWMSVFDLNRWYHAQMPHSVRCHGNSLQVCSYWAVYNLDDVADLMAPHSLLGVEVKGDKVLRFKNSSALPPEEHSFPSSLQMTEMRFVSGIGAVSGRCTGWQAGLLEEMALCGAELLVAPADFYHQCHRAKLLPQLYEQVKHNNAEYQRSCLLDMSLDRGVITSVVRQCLQLWGDGEFVQQGCSLSTLLDWAWERTIKIKAQLNSTCEVLYDWSATVIDSRTDRQLQASMESLCHLKKVFSSLMSDAPQPTSEQGLLELELRLEVINLLIQHHDVVRWCLQLQLGMLPEVDEVSDHDPNLFAYPITALGEKYRKKRAALSGCKGLVEDLSLLMIDGLVECEGDSVRRLWGDQGGTGLYPPPSMQALLYMYLLDGVSIQVKHAITLYLLQDLASLTDQDSDSLIPSFIQRFMLSPSMVHQVQGMWAVDAGDFEEGMRHLINPCVHEDVCGSCSGAAVVNTLLAQGQSKVAARYLHTRRAWGGSLQEQRLYVTTLLDIRQVSQALEFVRSGKESETRGLLMSHLLRQCQRDRILGQLLQLRLAEGEEEQLEAFLCQRGEASALEPLLLYYLHHSQFLKAFELHEDMKAMDRSNCHSLLVQEQAANRNKLMQAYLSALPDITKKLILEKKSISSAAALKKHEVSRPKPLSTVVRNPDRQVMSRSTFFGAVMEKVNETEQTLAEIAEDKNDSLSLDESLSKKASDTSQVPFLWTPKAHRQKEEHAFANKVVYPDFKISPSSKNALTSEARKRSLFEMLTTTNLNDSTVGNKSLQQLKSECAQLLHTPKKETKRRSSPRINPDLTGKTPQSILKVRRLSKVNVPNSSGRRTSTSYSRSRRMSSSKTESSNSKSMSSQSSSQQRKENTSPPNHLPVTSSAVTPKQLRFVGLSPAKSPTPPPSTPSPTQDQSFASTPGSTPSPRKDLHTPPPPSPTTEQMDDGEEMVKQITETVIKVVQETLQEKPDQPILTSESADQVHSTGEEQMIVSEDEENSFASFTQSPESTPIDRLTPSRFTPSPLPRKDLHTPPPKEPEPVEAIEHLLPESVEQATSEENSSLKVQRQEPVISEDEEQSAMEESAISEDESREPAVPVISEEDHATISEETPQPVVEVSEEQSTTSEHVGVSEEQPAISEHDKQPVIIEVAVTSEEKETTIFEQEEHVVIPEEQSTASEPQEQPEVPIISEEAPPATSDQPCLELPVVSEEEPLTSTPQEEQPITSQANSQEVEHLEEPVSEVPVESEYAEQHQDLSEGQEEEMVISEDEEITIRLPAVEENQEEQPVASIDYELLPTIIAPVLSESEEETEERVVMKGNEPVSGMSEDKEEEPVQEQQIMSKCEEEEEEKTIEQLLPPIERPVISDDEDAAISDDDEVTMSQTSSSLARTHTFTFSLPAQHDPDTTPEKKRRPDSPPPATPPCSKRLKLITGKSHHYSETTQDIRDFTAIESNRNEHCIASTSSNKGEVADGAPGNEQQTSDDIEHTVDNTITKVANDNVNDKITEAENVAKSIVEPVAENDKSVTDDKSDETEIEKEEREGSVSRKIVKAGRMRSKTPERVPAPSVTSSPSRRSTRLRTPDRMLAANQASASHVESKSGVGSVKVDQVALNETVDVKTAQDTEVSSSDQIVQQSASLQVEKTSESTAPEAEVFDNVLPLDADEAASEEIDTSKWVRRSSRRHSKTPDRFNLKSKEGKLSDIPSQEVAEFSFTRQTRGKSRSPTKADTKAEDVLDSSLMRRSRRQSKTPERFKKHSDETTKSTSSSSSSTLDTSVMRRTRKGSKLDPISETPSSPAPPPPSSPSRRTRRQSRTPDRGQGQSTLEASASQREEVETARRSTRQSRTPERLKGTVMTSPVRHSQRVTRLPEKLNTPEIQAVALPSNKSSPEKLKSFNKSVDPPATPPKMSVAKALSPSRKSMRKLKSPERLNTDIIEPVQSTSKSADPPATPPKMSVAKALSPSRKSMRTLKSPERLNTEDIQPVQSTSKSPRSDSPKNTSSASKSPVRALRRSTRSASREPSVPAARQSKRGRSREASSPETEDRGMQSAKKIKISTASSMKEIEEEKEEHVAEVTDWGTEEEMPPLRLDNDEDQKNESQVKSGRKLRKNSKEQPAEEQPKKKRGRPKKTLSSEDEVNLLESPVVSPTTRQRQLSSNQRARAAILKRYHYQDQNKAAAAKSPPYVNPLIRKPLRGRTARLLPSRPNRFGFDTTKKKTP